MSALFPLRPSILFPPAHLPFLREILPLLVGARAMQHPARPVADGQEGREPVDLKRFGREAPPHTLCNAGTA